MSSLHWWGYTGNKQIARVNTGQKNDNRVCHRGFLLTNVHAKNASFSENTCSCSKARKISELAHTSTDIQLYHTKKKTAISFTFKYFMIAKFNIFRHNLTFTICYTRKKAHIKALISVFGEEERDYSFILSWHNVLIYEKARILSTKTAFDPFLYNCLYLSSG